MSGGDWKDMFNGIQKGDLSLVRYYLSEGIDPNYQHPEFMAAPLIESIRFNHLDIAKLLLDNGADPNVREVWAGDTAMSVAKVKKNKAAIQLLKDYMD